MSRSFKLYRLQQIDSQLDWLHGRLQEIEAALKEDSALQQATENAHKAEEDLQRARKVLRTAEENVLQQRTKIEQNESTLYGGKMNNPKELKDLEKEVESLKRFLSVLEDRQLEAMMSEEETTSTYQILAADLEKIRLQTQMEARELTLEKDKLEKDVIRLEEERRISASAVEADDLDLYSNLREKRHGVAVAKVVDRACSACGSTLNTSLLHAVHSPNQLSLCDTCGRILYTG
jgi:predicted  nucleic acid-binding Zn-ribbon protein